MLDILTADMTPTEHLIRLGVYYVHTEKHRNGTPDAGRWTISEVDERNCFSSALLAEWIGDVEGWGIHTECGSVAYLGLDRYAAPSFVARFIDSGSTGVWHGFPKAPSDVPSPKALAAWLQNRLLRKKIVKLLAQGRSCDL